MIGQTFCQSLFLTVCVSIHAVASIVYKFKLKRAAGGSKKLRPSGKGLRSELFQANERHFRLESSAMPLHCTVEATVRGDKWSEDRTVRTAAALFR